MLSCVVYVLWGSFAPRVAVHAAAADCRCSSVGLATLLQLGSAVAL